jgi:hypothetical protein
MGERGDISNRRASDGLRGAAVGLPQGLPIHFLDRYVLPAERFDRCLSDASTLGTDDDRAVLDNSEAQAIARLQVRGGPNFLGYGRQPLAGYRGERHMEYPRRSSITASAAWRIINFGSIAMLVRLDKLWS